MIDIHAHFAGEEEDFFLAREKILRAGVKTVILAGDNLQNSKIHADFAKCTDGFYFTVGIHPENAGKDWDEGEFFRLGREEKCVAVGEIGLDYHYPGFDKAKQRELFLRQIEAANELSLPVQIHSRDACLDTLSILRENTPKAGFCLHCYSYGAENLNDFLSLGAYFSFGGVVCFSNAKKVRRAVEICPMDKILTETDSPYLSPFRGERNTPENIPVIVEELAKIKGKLKDEMEILSEENAKALFKKLS